MCKTRAYANPSLTVPSPSGIGKEIVSGADDKAVGASRLRLPEDEAFKRHDQGTEVFAGHLPDEVEIDVEVRVEGERGRI